MAEIETPPEDSSPARPTRIDSPATRDPGEKRTEGRRSGRGLDGVFLPIVVVVMLVAAWVANRPEEEGASLPVPDFSMPGIELEIPFELPYAMVRFKRPEASRLDLDVYLGQSHEHDGEGVEEVIVEVREALLASSARDESDIEIALEDSGAR